MTLLYPLTILRTGTTVKLLAAVAVVADGTDAQVVRVTGEDNVATIEEASRIVWRLVGDLRGLEIDVADTDQQAAIRLAGQPEKWIST